MVVNDNKKWKLDQWKSLNNMSQTYLAFWDRITMINFVLIWVNNIIILISKKF